MELFTSPNEEWEKDNFKIFIYGDSGVGKSFFWNTFSGETRLISTDGNFKELENKNFKKKTITQNNKHKYIDKNGKEQEVMIDGWLFFKNIVKTIKENKDFDNVKTIVVDVIHDIWTMCRKYMLNKMGLAHESEKGYGQAYDMINNEFFPVIKELTNIEDKNIIIIDHEKSSDGKKIPYTGASFYNKIAGYFQLKGRAYRLESENGEQFKISFNPTLQSVGANRFHLKAPIDNTQTALISAINENEQKGEK